MELLAPAGSIQSLKSAVFNGANAVYLGLDNFNARIKADGFTRGNIGEWTNFCHIYGVKVYVAFNTNVKNEELEEVKIYIEACRDANIDAFIVCDLGVLNIINKLAPKIPMHASTQMGVHNLEGAKYIQSLGFSRVVVARETTFEDIRQIKNETSLEVEYFAHGALCVGFSGQCLMSSIINGNSGNRGRCLQPCRLKYTSSISNEEKYYLSPSDLCMIEKLQILKDIGVDSLKIEGRLKRSEYVAETVLQYRQALDLGEVSPKMLDRLRAVYNRGNFSEGYNYDNTTQMMSIDVQGHIGIEIGEIIDCRVNPKSCEIKIKTNEKLNIGDGLKFVLNNEEVGGRLVESIKNEKVDIYVFYSNKPFVKGTKVFRTTDIIRNEELLQMTKKIPIDMEFSIVDNKMKLNVFNGDISISVDSEQEVELAKNKPTFIQEIKTQLEKMNDTEFVLNELNSDYLDNYFLPKSLLNALRRNAIELLRSKILSVYNDKKVVRASIDVPTKINEFDCDKKIIVEIEDEKQLSEYVVKNSIICINPHIFTLETLKSIMNKIEKYNNSTKILLKLPIFASFREIKVIRDILTYVQILMNDNTKKLNVGIYASNYYALTLAGEYKLSVFIGQGFNIYNNYATSLISVKKSFLLSPELSNIELQKFTKDAFVFAFGNLPLMLLKHCPHLLKKGGDCTTCKFSGDFYYQDRKTDFFVSRYKYLDNFSTTDKTKSKIINEKNEKFSYCQFVLYNSVKHNLGAKIDKIKHNYYMNMLQCSSKQIEETVKAYVLGETYIGDESYTYGHLFRGVF